jgi:hypothetical protein
VTLEPVPESAPCGPRQAEELRRFELIQLESALEPAVESFPGELWVETLRRVGHFWLEPVPESAPGEPRRVEELR